MLLPNETTVATPTAVSVYVWLWLQIIENIGISAHISVPTTKKAETEIFIADLTVVLDFLITFATALT